MSYYGLQSGTKVYEAAAGLGAFLRSKDRAGRYSPAKWIIPSAYSGLGGIEFSGAKGWSDQLACDAAYKANKTTVPQCKTWVNLMRAGLAQCGYGQLGQNQSWGSADIAAYNNWCAKNSMTQTTYPTQDGWLLMEKQVAGGVVTGDKPPVQMEKQGETFVPAGTAAGAGATKGGLSPMMIGVIAVGVIGLGALAIAAKKRKGTAPVTGSLQSASAPMKANLGKTSVKHRARPSAKKRALARKLARMYGVHERMAARRNCGR
jgi:hypothetical protein